MGEEMKRIEAANEAKQRRDASMSSNLTGEQIFVRSCNSCHPGGKVGVGPTLIDLETRFPKDAALVKFLRTGSPKGMPAQPEASINNEEMANLTEYLRELARRLNEPTK